MELPERHRRDAVRAMHNAFPPQPEAETVQRGHVVITTRRPGFWAADAEPPKTYGAMLDAMLLAAQNTYAAEQAAAVLPAPDPYQVQKEVSAAAEVCRQATHKYRADRTPDNFDALKAAEDALGAAQTAYKRAQDDQRRHECAMQDSFTPVARWLADAFRADFGVDFDREFGEEA